MPPEDNLAKKKLSQRQKSNSNNFLSSLPNTDPKKAIFEPQSIIKNLNLIYEKKS